MKGLYVILSLALLATPIHAQDFSSGNESVDLEYLYEQIDEAISESPHYVAVREKKISVCRDSFLLEKNPEKRIQLAEQLFHLYRPYKNDSALHYADLSIALSDSIHRPDLTGRFRSLMALQCSNTYMKAESLEQLHLVKRSALDKKGLVDYYNARMHLYGEMGSYTQRKDIRQNYFDMQNLYRDSVMMVAEVGSEEWCHLKMDILCAQRHFQDALQLNNRWMKQVKKGSHENAYAAFYRAIVFDHLNNHDMTNYWMGVSALYDIRSAVMDQASLLFLAERLANDGDLSRAQRYLEFSKACNLSFTPHLRLYQFNSVFNVIEKNRKAAHQQTNIVLIASCVVIALLLLALVIVIVRKRKKR